MSTKIEVPITRAHLAKRAMSAIQMTPELMTELVKAAGIRAASLNQRGIAIRHLTECIATEAWLDAPLLLIPIELPGWSLRRLVQEDRIWYCSLSRTPNIPIEFDDTVDTSHSDPAVAILLALLAERKEALAPGLVPEGAPSPDASIAMCSDNFS